MSEPLFSEKDLENLFRKNEPEAKPKTESKSEHKNFIFPHRMKPKNEPRIEDSFAREFGIKNNSYLQVIGKYFGTFCLLFILSFVIINGPALYEKLRYFWISDVRHASLASATEIPEPTSQESRLIIPKIGIDVPILWNVPENDFMTSLENGVVHYQNTAIPGETGNVFIFGHSSNYLWAPGDYKDVFALLNKLEGSDKIYIQYLGKTYTYEVISQIVVNPDNLSVLEPSANKTLSLMTCVPIGTNLQRLVVTALQN